MDMPTASVAMRPRRLGHANIFVSDLQRSLAFYNKVLGLELVRLEPEIEAGFLSAGSTHHDIGLMQAANKPRIGLGGHVQIPTGRGTRAGLNHLGWEMESEAELVAAYRRALAAGVEVNRTTDHQISHSVYMYDPDGNLNEFYADAIDDWRTIFNLDQESLISGHWDPEAAPPSSQPRYAANPVIRQVEGAVFHPVRITHSLMIAQDFEAMRAYYTGVAGLVPIEEKPGRSVILRAAAGNFDLAIAARRGDQQPGLRHIAFRLSDDEDLDRCGAALAERGVAIVRATDGAGRRGIVLADPDGIAIELYRQPGGAAAAFDLEAWMD